MRLDKYLKVSRIIKRRTVAKNLLDRGLFLINGKVAKPSSEVEVGDVVELSLGRHKITIKVKELAPYVKKEESINLYVVLSDEIIEVIYDEIS